MTLDDCLSVIPNNHSELGQIHSELLSRGIDRSVLIHGLDPLAAQSQTDPTSQIIGVEPLPLQIHLLNLVDALVREGDDAGLAVGGLSEEVARPLPHDEGGARRLGGGGGGASQLEGGAREGGRCGDDQGDEKGGDGGSHGERLEMMMMLAVR